MSIVLGKAFQVRLADVCSRPSKVIRTPYVADVFINEDIDDSINALAHTPSLGCNGMVDTGAKVFIIEKEATSKAKCRYTVIASRIEEKGETIIVGVEPSFGEKIGEDILRNGLIDSFHVKKLDKQFVYEDCRFDFSGITSSNEAFICEVKNVSIAVYENIRPSQLKKRDYTTRDVRSKIGIFPSGFKPKGQTHSERAVKQTQRLTQIKQKHPEVRCLILYVIQRSDINEFQISNGDEIYMKTIKEAVSSGIELAAVSINWTICAESSALIPIVCNSSVKVSLDYSI